MKTHLMIGAALSAPLWGGAAGAGSADYTGNWPITISHAQYYNGNYCLALNGSTGGGATLTGPLGNLYGNFQVLRANLVAIVPLQNSGGFNTGEEFILPAKNGNLAKGTYLEDGDGELDNSGTAKVGTKNGC